jgi:hypothetical protein
MGAHHPLSPCISRAMRLRWAPCRKLNWERDALTACLCNRLVLRLRVVAHINCVAILRWEWSSPSSRSPSSPPQHQVHSYFGSYHPQLSIFAPRLSFNCCCCRRSSHNLAKSIIRFYFHFHSINYTVNMKYQLIALPALAATVAAQDLYVDSSRSNQHRIID